MSDQGPNEPGPGFAPAPPPPPYEPPPGYAPQPAPQSAPQPAYAPGAPYSPGPPAPKKRSAVVTLVVVIAIVGCAVLACVGTVAYNVVTAEARTRDAVKQAESHLDTATTELEAATDALDTYLDDGEAASEESAGARLRATRDEIAAARATIEPLPDSEGKSTYLEALSEATAAVESLEQMLGTVTVIVDLADQVKQGGDHVEVANEALNAAVGAGNSRDFATMKAKARVASREYSAGARIFGAAHEDEPAAGLDAVVEYANLRKQQADLVAKMADEGKAGRAASYNKLVERQAALGEKAEKAGTPDIVSDPEWGERMIGEQQASFERAAGRADELRAQALKAFGLLD